MRPESTGAVTVRTARATLMVLLAAEQDSHVRAYLETAEGVTPLWIDVITLGRLFMATGMKSSGIVPLPLTPAWADPVVPYDGPRRRPPGRFEAVPVE